jgi:aminopeptidase N
MKTLYFAGMLALSAGITACSTQTPKERSAVTQDTLSRDVHTLSNSDSISAKHLSLDLTVDFDKKELRGSATWEVKNEKGAKELILDSRKLNISKVLLDGKEGTFYIGKTVPFLGEALHIPVLPAVQKVQIFYQTAPGAEALQWLTAAQTESKVAPFLYTQSEAVQARSWFPAPDGPGIRFTYEARITAPKGLLALMSAENPQAVSDSGVYSFKMEEPIPAYLVALAVGKLEFKAEGPRTGVYAEPTVIARASKELEDLEQLVKTAEDLYGPYRWGRYDVLILPPGFPIGGMENPRLTFATPTILAGDKSLVNLISHELAHNWSGNLVTSATWNDLWMNEGFTVYFERRITEALQGRDYVAMLWELGYQDLETAVTEMGPQSRETWLKGDLAGKDPEGSLSDIPYEKGSLLLRLIEETVGRQQWDGFLKAYFNRHAFKSITTESFLADLHRELSDKDSTLEKKVELAKWVYGPGIPQNAPRADTTRFAAVNRQREAFLAGGAAGSLQTGKWTTHEWLHFLRKMPQPLTTNQMAQLDAAFHFTTSGNSEIADLWYERAIRAGYKPAYGAMEQFLSRVGRQKFLTPLYTALVESGQGAEAKRLFAQYQQNYHPLAQKRMNEIISK